MFNWYKLNVEVYIVLTIKMIHDYYFNFFLEINNTFSKSES